jgi:hypothetical protein
MTVEQIKELIQDGQRKSIDPEIRPSNIKNANGSIKPFYPSRTFTYLNYFFFVFLLSQYLVMKITENKGNK